MPCPGDPGLFCGGIIDLRATDGSGPQVTPGSLKRRDAPPNILLTIYTLAVDTTEASSGTISTATSALIQSVSSSTSTFFPASSSSPVSSPSPISSFSPASPFSSTVTEDLIVILPDGSLSTVTAVSGVSVLASDSTYNLAQTITEAATTVATVLYTAVNLLDPSELTVSRIYVTMTYSSCPICPNQGIPSVEMTTVEAICSACGYHGENDIILTIPKAACPTLRNTIIDSATSGEQAQESAGYQQSLPDATSVDVEVLPTGPVARPGIHLSGEIMSASEIYQLSASAAQQLSATGTQQPPDSVAQQLSNSAAQQPQAYNSPQSPASAVQQLPGSTGHQSYNTAGQQFSYFTAAQQHPDSGSAAEQLPNSAAQQLSNSISDSQQISASATQQLPASVTHQLSDLAVQQLSVSASAAQHPPEAMNTKTGCFEGEGGQTEATLHPTAELSGSDMSTKTKGTEGQGEGETEAALHTALPTAELADSNMKPTPAGNSATFELSTLSAAGTLSTPRLPLEVTAKGAKNLMVLSHLVRTFVVVVILLVS
jgi:hypothetical protein